MSSGVHSAEGRECGICGHKFTPSSMNLSVTIRKSEGVLHKARVCGKCWRTHHEKGE